MSDKLQNLIDLLYKGAPLQERIEESAKMIGMMCSESRPPKMSIPAQWYDEDFYITETLKQAGRRIADLERQNKLLRAALNEVRYSEYCPACSAGMNDLHGENCALQAALDGGAMGEVE